MIGEKRRRRAPANVRADINVTPLVDVVLVLLIIFMVVTPMISQGMPVELPRTVNHDRKPDDGKDLLVSVSRQGQVYLRSNPVSVGDVARLVEAERRRAPGRKVFLLGDSQGGFGTVRGVMEAIRKGGNVDEVLLRTDEIRVEARPQGSP
jgi:biopolymer transport protein TolR